MKKWKTNIIEINSKRRNSWEKKIVADMSWSQGNRSRLDLSE